MNRRESTGRSRLTDIRKMHRQTVMDNSEGGSSRKGGNEVNEMQDVRGMFYLFEYVLDAIHAYLAHY